VQKTSSTYATLFASTHLGINILSADQLDTVGRFSRSGADKFDGLAWHAGPAGSPLIDNSAAALEAEIRERFQAKTHTIFVCRVRHAEIGDDDPMIYRAGKFFHSADLRSL
jgi:flavin reductase (DIM6/NTAB) family NADH-FMN oxidoreductase RutF